jgi:hypothetical protein
MKLSFCFSFCIFFVHEYNSYLSVHYRFVFLRRQRMETPICTYTMTSYFQPFPYHCLGWIVGHKVGKKVHSYVMEGLVDHSLVKSLVQCESCQ